MCRHGSGVCLLLHPGLVMPVSPLSVVALLPVGLVLVLLLRGHFRRGSPGRPLLHAVLLFDGDDLVDSTGIAVTDPVLYDAARQGRDAAIAVLHTRFADLGTALDQPGVTARTFSFQAGSIHLLVERWADFSRFTLTGPAEAGTAQRIASLEGELRILRTIAEDTPSPIWREDAESRVIWANRAYLDLASRVLPSDSAGVATWPLRSIFPEQTDPDTPMPLTLPDDDTLWFNVSRTARGAETLGFAADTSRIVAAEAARKEFVQTLARTFADLRTGLLVFDRRRRLVLFNPAFPDLTGLPPEFLARRPHVRTMLDRMRDAGILPEPRDWARWRDRIASLQTRARDGNYCENWSLPDGRVFRVTGRPHPDGALAFFIEDATDEISLSRHMRLGQDVLMEMIDHLPQAIAIFSASGGLILCNRAYDELWDDRAGLTDRTLLQEITLWRQTDPDAPVWDRLDPDPAGDGIGATEARLIHTDRGSLQMRLLPLGKGRLAVEFSDATDGPVAAHRMHLAIGRA